MDIDIAATAVALALFHRDGLELSGFSTISDEQFFEILYEKASEEGISDLARSAVQRYHEMRDEIGMQIDDFEKLFRENVPKLRSGPMYGHRWVWMALLSFIVTLLMIRSAVVEVDEKGLVKPENTYLFYAGLAALLKDRLTPRRFLVKNDWQEAQEVVVRAIENPLSKRGPRPFKLTDNNDLGGLKIVGDATDYAKRHHFVLYTENMGLLPVIVEEKNTLQKIPETFKDLSVDQNATPVAIRISNDNGTYTEVNAPLDKRRQFGLWSIVALGENGEAHATVPNRDAGTIGGNLHFVPDDDDANVAIPIGISMRLFSRAGFAIILRGIGEIAFSGLLTTIVDGDPRAVAKDYVRSDLFLKAATLIMESTVFGGGTLLGLALVYPLLPTFAISSIEAITMDEQYLEYADLLSWQKGIFIPKRFRVIFAVCLIVNYAHKPIFKVGKFFYKKSRGRQETPKAVEAGLNFIEEQFAKIFVFGAKKFTIAPGRDIYHAATPAQQQQADASFRSTWKAMRQDEQIRRLRDS